MNQIMIILSIIVMISIIFTITAMMSNYQNKFVLLANMLRQSVRAFSIWQCSAIIAITTIISLVLFYKSLQIEGILFIVGSLQILILGVYHMYLSTYTNMQIANNIKHGLISGFMSGVINNGFSSILLHALSVIQVFILYKYFDLSRILYFITGSALSALTIRLTGGVFTKSADMGADLLGKLEMDLQEDDNKNPLVTADNAGDLTGDSLIAATGMIETWQVCLIAGIHLISMNSILSMSIISIVSSFILSFGFKFLLNLMPIIASLMTYMILCCGVIFGLIGYFHVFTSNNLILFGIGLIISLLTFLIAYRFTNGTSVKKVATLTQNGVAMSVVGGLSESYLAIAVFGCLIISLLCILNYYGLSLNSLIYVVLGGISLSPAILIQDNLGPVFDNAASFIETYEPENRLIADELDRIGNTTKAVTKIYGIIFIILSMLVWMFIYFIKVKINLINNRFWINMLYGIVISAFATYLSLNSVSETAFNIIEYTRDKLKIWNNNITFANHLTVVEELTKNSILTIFKPLVLFIISPMIYCYYSKLPENAFVMLIGVFIFSIITSLKMTIAGSLWDNVKKYLELQGYKKEPIYKQAVIADTIGDPFKDTTGPLLSGLIKFLPFMMMLILNCCK